MRGENRVGERRETGKEERNGRSAALLQQELCREAAVLQPGKERDVSEWLQRRRLSDSSALFACLFLLTFVITRHGILTSHFVSDEFAGLDFADGGKEGPDLLLSHGLGQVVDDEIRLTVLRSLRRVGRPRRSHAAVPAVHQAAVVAVCLCRRRVHSVHVPLFDSRRGDNVPDLREPLLLSYSCLLQSSCASESQSSPGSSSLAAGVV